MAVRKAGFACTAWGGTEMVVVAFVVLGAALGMGGCARATEPKLEEGAAAPVSTLQDGESPPPSSPPTEAPALLDAEDAAPPPEPVVVAPTHPVFDLIDNRFLAHPMLAGGLVARLGLPWGAKYTRAVHHPNWEHDAVRDGVPMTLREGSEASLHVPLSRLQAERVTHVALGLWSTTSNQTMELSLNGQKLEAQTLGASGWAVVDVAIPPNTAREGENALTLAFSRTNRLDAHRTGAGLASVGLLPADVPAEVVTPTAVRVPEGRAGGLSLPARGGLAWYLYVPPEATLVVNGTGPEGCVVELAVEGREATSHTLPANGTPVRMDLSKHAEDVVRLELVASDACGEELALSGAALHVPGEAPSILDVPAPKNIVVWLVDTLRADHLSTYNPDTDVKTPNFDGFAETATVFENAYVEGNESKVSHASLFSGLYPIRHRHYRSTTVLADSFELLPEAMHRAGRATAGFISNGYVSKKWGFGQGWDRYVNTIREGRANGADDLVRLAKPWMAAKSQLAPFFVYFGTVDPHVHYYRHAEFIGLYDPLDAENMRRKTFQWKASGSQIHDIAAGKLQIDEQDKARIKALYKNEISWNDKYFGAMLAHLDALGIRDETMVVVVADHGEEFFEHGGVGHARTLYQHTVHVPLIVSYPPMFPPGTRVSEGVDVLDVYSTLVAAVGLDPAPEGLQGGDLRALAQGVDAGYPRPTIATMGSRRYVWNLGGFKLHVEYKGDVRLYDLAKDPWEQNDLFPSGDARATARWLIDTSATFLAYRTDWDKMAMGVASNLEPGFAAVTLERE